MEYRAIDLHKTESQIRIVTKEGDPKPENRDTGR